MFYVVHAYIEFFGEVVTSLRGADFWSCVSFAKKLMVSRVVSYDIGERRSVQDEENGPQY